MPSQNIPQLSPLQLYQLLHTGNPLDVEFYLSAAEGAASVLELGCGWGRISQRLVATGVQYVGVDTQESFVRAARLKCPAGEFVVGDATELCLNPGGIEQSFERIFLPYNFLYALGGIDAVRKCLHGVRSHLTESGEVWFDVYSMDALQLALDQGEDAPPDDDEPVLETDSPVGVIVVYEQTEIDGKAQRLDVTYRADAEGRPAGELRMTHDYLTTTQLLELLSEAGLQVNMTLGSFDGAPFDAEAEQFIVSASAKSH